MLCEHERSLQPRKSALPGLVQNRFTAPLVQHGGWIAWLHVPRCLPCWLAALVGGKPEGTCSPLVVPCASPQLGRPKASSRPAACRQQGRQLTGHAAQHKEPRYPAQLGHASLHMKLSAAEQVCMANLLGVCHQALHGAGLASAPGCDSRRSSTQSGSRALRGRCSASDCAQTWGEVLQTRRAAYLWPAARRRPADACGPGRPTAPGSLARPRCPHRRPRRRGRCRQPQTGP